MPTEKITIDGLMSLLVEKVGLPSQARTDNPESTFADIGLDSLAFLQLQAELKTLYGVELPTDRPQSFTFGEIINHVNGNAAVTERSAA